MRVRLAMRPYKYMRDMTPKREKIAKKCTFIFEIVLCGMRSLQNYSIWCLAYELEGEVRRTRKSRREVPRAYA